MKIATELNYDTYQNIGWQAMYLIATLPQEEREKERLLKRLEEDNKGDDTYEYF